MRNKELLKKIGKEPSCLGCEPVLAHIQKEGNGDFSYAIRRIAEMVWGNEDIEEKKKQLLNEKLAFIVRAFSGEIKESKEEIEKIVNHVDILVRTVPDLTDVWFELREIIVEQT